MKIVLQQQKFESTLALANRISSSKTTLPILSHVLLTTDNGRLKIASTNLEVSVSAYIGAHVEDEGSIAVPTNLLHNYVQSLAPEKLTLSTEGNSFLVTGATTSAEFLTMPAEEFPEFPGVGEQVLLRLSPVRLQEILKKLLFAAATTDSRPVLTGVLFRGTPEGVILVATDGFRLAELTVEWKDLGAEPPTESFEMIIPAKMLKDIGQFSIESVQDELWNLIMTKDKNQVVFASSDVQLYARLIEAEFPQYENIIPKEHSVTVTFETEPLLRAVKTAALFSQTQSHTVQLQIQSKEQSVRVFAESKDRGKQESTLPVTIEGEDITTGFNAAYLIDAISAFDTSSVQLKMKQAESPALFLAPDESTISVRQVVMPIRLDQNAS